MLGSFRNILYYKWIRLSFGSSIWLQLTTRLFFSDPLNSICFLTNLNRIRSSWDFILKKVIEVAKNLKFAEIMFAEKRMQKKNLRQNIIVSENPLKLRNKVYVKGLHLNFSQVYVLSSNLSDIILFQEIAQQAGYHQELSTFHNGPGALCCLKIFSIESNLANKVSYCVEVKLKTEIWKDAHMEKIYLPFK